MKDSLIYILIYLLDKICPYDDTKWRIYHESRDGEFAGMLPNQDRQQVMEFLLMDQKRSGYLHWEITNHFPEYYTEKPEDGSVA